MSLYKTYATDSKKESEGVNIEFEANEDGSIPIFTVARIDQSNKEFSKALDIATKPFRRQMQLGALPKEKDEAIMLDVFVSTILKNWQNVQDENGNNLEFNKENAKKLFTDLPELYKQLRMQASDIALFRTESLESEAKN